MQFASEEVLLAVDEDEVSVEGKYYLRNREKASIRVRLFYPFPTNRDHAYPYHMEVEGHQFERMKKGIAFRLEFGPLELKELVVRYKQRISTNRTRYILTTTREWGEPIETARFVVSIPKVFEVSTSYEPDSAVTRGDRIFCYIEERNLFPTQDLIVSWGTPEQGSGL